MALSEKIGKALTNAALEAPHFVFSVSETGDSEYPFLVTYGEWPVGPWTDGKECRTEEEALRTLSLYIAEATAAGTGLVEPAASSVVKFGTPLERVEKAARRACLIAPGYTFAVWETDDPEFPICVGYKETTQSGEFDPDSSWVDEDGCINEEDAILTLNRYVSEIIGGDFLAAIVQPPIEQAPASETAGGSPLRGALIMPVITFTQFADFLRELGKSRDELHLPITFQEFSQEKALKKIVRVEGFVHAQPHQAGSYLRHYVAVTARHGDEILAIQFHIGTTDYWGKEFPSHEEDRQRLIDLTAQTVQKITGILEKEGFEVRGGRYSTGEAKLPSVGREELESR